MCSTQYDSLPKDQKKKANVLIRLENLTLDFVEDDLSLVQPVIFQ